MSEESEARDTMSVDGTEVQMRRAFTLPAKNKKISLLRPTSFASIISPTRRIKPSPSIASSTPEGPDDVSVANLSVASHGKNGFTRGSIVVTIVLVEAKGLPELPVDGSSHGIYCKIQLGSNSVKSKTVPNTRQPKWKQRFKLRYQSNILKLSLWDKGKQKNFMGSSDLDLSTLEMERTHELWQDLDDGFGSLHLSVTICKVGKLDDTIPEGNEERNLDGVSKDYAWYNINNDWNSVGQLQVRVHGAKGLSGKPNAYCILELDNERVQTPSAGTTTEPTWNKDYIFNVHDITSTLDIKVHDSSLVNIIQNDFLGKISIPLLRIKNSEVRWFALKDKSKRGSAKGNCPRILLEMTMVWNPVKATLKMFRPKEVKYIKRPKKFDIPLIYNNIEFIRDTFHLLHEINERFKRLFEWENRELSCVALLSWLTFWFFFELWMLPLMLLLPFLYFGLFHRDDLVESNHSEDVPTEKDEKTIPKRIKGLPEMTLTITDGIEYIAATAERLYNLVSFKVPFLSSVTMLLLFGAAIVIRIVPFNYLLMALGAYKFTRKYLDPERELNNDLLDFLSHIPDNVVLKDCKELSVPEPLQRTSNTLTRSQSNNL